MLWIWTVEIQNASLSGLVHSNNITLFTITGLLLFSTRLHWYTSSTRFSRIKKEFRLSTQTVWHQEVVHYTSAHQKNNKATNHVWTFSILHFHKTEKWISANETSVYLYFIHTLLWAKTRHSIILELEQVTLSKSFVTIVLSIRCRKTYSFIFYPMPLHYSSYTVRPTQTVWQSFSLSKDSSVLILSKSAIWPWVQNGTTSNLSASVIAVIS